MNKYEAMFIIKPDLKEDDKTSVLKTIKDQILKHEGRLLQDQIWAERRKFAYDLFPLGGQTRFKEGMYYLVNFEIAAPAITALKNYFSLNESILRYLILRVEERAGIVKKIA